MRKHNQIKMAGKVKVTGFTRFLLFLIIAAPLAYMGASYFNGQDGVENIKNIFNEGEKTEIPAEERSSSSSATASDDKIKDLRAEIKILKEEIKEKDQRIEDLYKQVKQLREQ